MAVQSDQGAISLEAAECLQSAVGIEGNARRLFKDRLPDVSETAHSGLVLLGVILGLLAAQAAEPDSQRSTNV